MNIFSIYSTKNSSLKDIFEFRSNGGVVRGETKLKLTLKSFHFLLVEQPTWMSWNIRHISVFVRCFLFFQILIQIPKHSSPTVQQSTIKKKKLTLKWSKKKTRWKIQTYTSILGEYIYESIIFYPQRLFRFYYFSSDIQTFFSFSILCINWWSFVRSMVVVITVFCHHRVIFFNFSLFFVLFLFFNSLLFSRVLNARRISVVFCFYELYLSRTAAALQSFCLALAFISVQTLQQRVTGRNSN